MCIAVHTPSDYQVLLRISAIAGIVATPSARSCYILDVICNQQHFNTYTRMYTPYYPHPISQHPHPYPFHTLFPTPTHHTPHGLQRTAEHCMQRGAGVSPRCHTRLEHLCGRSACVVVLGAWRGVAWGGVGRRGAAWGGNPGLAVFACVRYGGTLPWAPLLLAGPIWLLGVYWHYCLAVTILYSK